MFNRVADKGQEHQWKPCKFENFKKFSGEDKTFSGRSELKPGSDFSILYSKNQPDDGFTSYIHYCDEQTGKKNISGDQSVSPGFSSKKYPEEQVQDSQETERTAFERGFSEGEKKGYEEGEKKADEIVTSMQQILREMKGLWKNMVTAYEKEIIRMTCRVAEKVVYGSVAVDHEIVKRSILHAFELIPEPVDVTIAVSTKDYEYIEEIKREFFETVKDLKHVSVISDPAVDRGGCKIETRSGQIDARLESRLHAIQQSLIDTCEKR